MWNMPAWLCPGKLKRFVENYGGCDAVHIVVAVDFNLLAPRDCALDALNRAVHIFQEKWIMEIFDTRIQKVQDRIGIAETTALEDLQCCVGKA